MVSTTMSNRFKITKCKYSRTFGKLPEDGILIPKHVAIIEELEN
jgi:hypothetical protein